MAESSPEKSDLPEATDGIDTGDTLDTATTAAIELSPFVIDHVVRSHTGLVRQANEDSALVLAASGLFVVADGMGGHAAGQVASKICVDALAAFFSDPDRESLTGSMTMPAPSLSREANELVVAIQGANRSIFEAAQEDTTLAGMGTTVVAARIVGNTVAIANAGDSRCYVDRQGSLIQLTVDHSLSNFLYSLGRSTEAMLAEATMSNVIMRALGLEPEVAIDVQEMQLLPGDRLLLCSDGLTDMVSGNDIQQLLSNEEQTLDEIADNLIDAALEGGGRDNVTIAIIDIAEEHEGFTRDSDRTSPAQPGIEKLEAIEPDEGAETDGAAAKSVEAQAEEGVVVSEEVGDGHPGTAAEPPRDEMIVVGAAQELASIDDEQLRTTLPLPDEPDDADDAADEPDDESTGDD